MTSVGFPEAEEAKVTVDEIEAPEEAEADAMEAEADATEEAEAVADEAPAAEEAAEAEAPAEEAADDMEVEAHMTEEAEVASEEAPASEDVAEPEAPAQEQAAADEVQADADATEKAPAAEDVAEAEEPAKEQAADGMEAVQQVSVEETSTVEGQSLEEKGTELPTARTEETVAPDTAAEEADAEVDGKKSGLGWLYASTVAVGQTLRSPMRGARSLAERLRSRANTGEKEDEAAAATSVAGPAALNSAGAAPELERARQRAKRAAQRPKRSHLEQFPAKDDAEEAEEEDAEEDALQEPDAPDAPAEPMESAAPAEEPKTETSMPEEVARPTKRAKTEEAESKAEVQAAETSPKKTTAALPTESPRATTEAVQPLEPAVFDVDPLGEPLEGPLDEEESEEPCEVGDMKEQLARRRKRLESQLFATGKRRKKADGWPKQEVKAEPKMKKEIQREAAAVKRELGQGTAPRMVGASPGSLLKRRRRGPNDQDEHCEAESPMKQGRVLRGLPRTDLLQMAGHLERRYLCGNSLAVAA